MTLQQFTQIADALRLAVVSSETADLYFAEVLGTEMVPSAETVQLRAAEHLFRVTADVR